MPDRSDSARHLLAHAKRLREIAETNPQLSSELTRMARHLEAEGNNLEVTSPDGQGQPEKGDGQT